MEHKKIWYAPNKFEAYDQEEIDAVVECLKAGWLAPGPLTEKFEAKMSALFGKKCGVFVNSGSSANMLALCVAGISKGDEVVTPACTFSTTVAPIVQLGATPVFCDVEHRRYVPSVEQVMAVVTPRTKAIFIPNLIGSKPDWSELRRRLEGRPIVLIEDSCDTITHTEDSDMSVTSFYASHVITAGGCGGMVMFNCEEQRKKALMYRDWGRIGNNTEDVSERFAHNVDGIEYDFKFLYAVHGYNFKASEMNAAFGLKQLDKLDRFFVQRRKNVERYMERLKDVSHLVLPDDSGKYNWLAMPFLSPYRKQLLTYLEQHNVQTRVCFAGNITRHPAYREFYCEFPEADRCMREGFLLGAHHGLTEEDVDHVCDLIIAFKPEAQE